MVKRRYADYNKSRLEAFTALHLRCAGYLRKEVEEELERHSPAPAHPDDLSPKIGYLRRILDYAFGAQGDIIIIEKRLTQSDVEQFNKEAQYTNLSINCEQNKVNGYYHAKIRLK